MQPSEFLIVTSLDGNLTVADWGCKIQLLRVSQAEARGIWVLLYCRIIRQHKYAVRGRDTVADIAADSLTNRR